MLVIMQDDIRQLEEEDERIQLKLNKFQMYNLRGIALENDVTLNFLFRVITNLFLESFWDNNLDNKIALERIYNNPKYAYNLERDYIKHQIENDPELRKYLANHI